MERLFKLFVGFFIIAIIGLTLITLNPEWRSWYGQKQADATQEIFTQSKPFVNGSIQQLMKLKLEYDMAETEEHRQAILYTARVQYANLDMEKVPSDLREWLGR